MSNFDDVTKENIKEHNPYLEKLEKFNKINLISNGYKRIQSIDSIETYGYGKSKDLISKNEEIKCNDIIKPYKIE